MEGELGLGAMHGVCVHFVSLVCVCGYVGYGVLIAAPQFGGDEDVCELRFVILMWWLVMGIGFRAHITSFRF
jgi:hypothetical protein